MKKKIFLIVLVVFVSLIVISLITSVIRNNYVYKTLSNEDEMVMPSVDFVQPSMLKDYKEADYDLYFNTLKNAGYQSVILQFTRYRYYDSIEGHEINEVYYESNKMSSYYEYLNEDYNNILGSLLSNAEKNNFNVYVGLSVDDADWWGVTCYYDEEFMNKLAEVDNIMIEEIYNLYGKSKAFKGWYWAHELFSNPVHMEKIWAKLINSAIDKLNEIDPTRPLILSPFRHVQTGLVTNEYRMWKRFFKAVNFRKGDIFAPQDSMGKLNQKNGDSPSKKSYKLIYDYLNDVKRSVDEEDGLILWINCELFQKENGDEYNTANFERTILQFKNASRVTDTLVTFSFSHYVFIGGTNDTKEARTSYYNKYISLIEKQAQK